MTEDTGNIVLEQLRQMRSWMRTEFASIKDDTRETRTRLVLVESGIAALRRDFADLAATQAAQHLAHDRLVDRVDRIERRLDIVDAD